jgi:proton-translocating NADH-quinone oxidoreductase chain N
MNFAKLINIDFADVIHQSDFLSMYPELFLVNASLILLVYGVVISTFSQYLHPLVIRNIGWLGVNVLIMTGLLLYSSPLTHGVMAYNIFVIDDFTFFFKSLILLGSISSILLALDYYKQESLNSYESVILILLSTCSMLFLVSSYDLIAMYLAIELQGLSFYILAASKRNSEFSTEAGLKYFILGAFSSGILLFGCSMIYGFTGLTQFQALAKFFTGLSTMPLATFSGFLLGILFLAVGFLFKLTVVPFHMWVPDVYEGSPTSVTAFFAIVPKIAILSVFLKLFLFIFYEVFFSWQQIFIFCSMASMVVGSIAAIYQKKIKRLLAFSSIGHMGYILVGVCCGTLDGVQATLLYMTIYVIMTINIFAVVLALKAEGSSFRLKYLEDFSILSRSNPVLALSVMLVLFSMAGIPPLAGFYSKFHIFFVALESSLFALAFVGIITSVISCFYYIRFIKIMYFDKPVKWVVYQPMDREKSLLLGITLFFIVFFFCYPSPCFLLTYQVAIGFCF